MNHEAEQESNNKNNKRGPIKGTRQIMIDCDLWGLCERQILELAMTSYNKPKRYFEKSGVV